MKELFRRKELKYVLDPLQRQAFVERLNQFLEPDAFHDYPIRSVYLDTSDCRLLTECIRKPAYREKLRVRMYENGQNFLEVKKKWQGVTHKARTSLEDSQLESLLSGHPVSCGGEAGRILQERNCQPVFSVQYHRLAWHWKQDPDLRITLDDSLLWQDLQGCSRQLLPGDHYVLEIKSAMPLPFDLARTLSELALQPASVSKAGRAFQALSLEKQRKETLQCMK